MVNWFYDSLVEGMVGWGDDIGKMDFNDLINKVRRDSFKIIPKYKIIDKDLVFIQFSFLDRIGHALTFQSRDVMMKSYFLAYELLDRLVELTSPKYVVAASDHGFWRTLNEHNGANCAITILNEASQLVRVNID